MPARVDLRDLAPPRVAEFCRQLGLSAAQARQAFAWVCRPGVRDFSGMGTVRKGLRALMDQKARLSRLEPAATERSADGTVKFAFRLDDGAVIESVLIPGAGRHTLCVSTQAGCAMGCRFCRTAALGFRRDLTAAEIVNQVLAAQEHLVDAGVERPTPRQLIENVVFMGMGEPLANYENLLGALAILMDEGGFGFSERRVTVSTCGLAPKIRDLGRDVKVNLAVSLNAVDDATRSGLMPVNRSWGVGELLEACRAFAAPGRRVVFFEWILLSGVNDSPADARRLAESLRGIPCRVNLLPYNASPAQPYRASSQERTREFKQILHAAGYRTLVRNSRGTDISAACGQLAAGALADGRRGVLLNAAGPPGRP
jgi:23S rRNA (adenine2503-C2)-methyltransferase